MTDRKLRVSLVYKDSFLMHIPTNLYAQLLPAMHGSSRFELTQFVGDKEYDIRKLPDTDIILILDNYNRVTPDRLEGIQNSGIPVFCFAGDVHNVEYEDRIPYHEKYKIDCYFQSIPESVFYQYYPKSFVYHRVPFGVQPSLYRTVRTFEHRVKDEILVSGVMPKRTNPLFRFAQHFLGRDQKTRKFYFERHPHSFYYYYALRAKCSKLPYVSHSTALSLETYVMLLSDYRASITACTVFPVIKYAESTAAGCLTFMEITKRNGGAEWGFKDGENAIFIDEKNYKKKFEEYLADVDNPKWAEIAAAGREYTMNNLANDTGMDRLADLMWEYKK